MKTKYKFVGIITCLVLVATIFVAINKKGQTVTDTLPPAEQDQSSLYEANGQAKRPEQVVDKFVKIKDAPVEASLTAFRITKSDGTYKVVDLKDMLKPTDRSGENFDPNGQWGIMDGFWYVKQINKLYFTISFPELSGNAFNPINLYVLDLNSDSYHMVDNVNNSRDFKFSPSQDYLYYTVSERLYPGGRIWLELINTSTGEKTIVDPAPNIFDYKKNFGLTEGDEVSEKIVLDSWTNNGQISVIQTISVIPKGTSRRVDVVTKLTFDLKSKAYARVSQKVEALIENSETGNYELTASMDSDYKWAPK